MEKAFNSPEETALVTSVMINHTLWWDPTLWADATDMDFGHTESYSMWRGALASPRRTGCWGPLRPTHVSSPCNRTYCHTWRHQEWGCGSRASLDVHIHPNPITVDLQNIPLVIDF